MSLISSECAPAPSAITRELKSPDANAMSGSRVNGGDSKGSVAPMPNQSGISGVVAISTPPSNTSNWSVTTAKSVMTKLQPEAGQLSVHTVPPSGALKKSPANIGDAAEP